MQQQKAQNFITICSRIPGCDRANEKPFTLRMNDSEQITMKAQFVAFSELLHKYIYWYLV